MKFGPEHALMLYGLIAPLAIAVVGIAIMSIEGFITRWLMRLRARRNPRPMPPISREPLPYWRNHKVTKESRDV